MATTLKQSENLQMANVLWKLIEPQDAEVKETLRQRLNKSIEHYTFTPALSAHEIVERLSGILKDIPQELFVCDDRAQYILNK